MRHGQRKTPASSDQSDSDDDVPSAQYWFRVSRQTESEIPDMSTTRVLQKHPITSPSLPKQTRSTTSAEESRIQPSGALEEHVLMSEQSDSECEQIAENDNDSEHEDQSQCDTNHDRFNDVPQCESVRRSTRSKRAPKTLTYESLGQPSYEPQGAVNTVGPFGTLLAVTASMGEDLLMVC